MFKMQKINKWNLENQKIKELTKISSLFLLGIILLFFFNRIDFKSYV